MAEEFIKSVDQEMVKIEVEFTKKFFDLMTRSKDDVAETRGYDVEYGQYIEEAIADFLKIIDDQNLCIMLLEARQQSQEIETQEPSIEIKKDSTNPMFG